MVQDISMFTVLLDYGHGKDTDGKRSPKNASGKSDLYEWEFNRDLGNRIREFLEVEGIRCVPIIQEKDGDKDISLTERASRVCKYVKEHKGETCVFISVHGNAAGNGKTWMNAKGWSAWTTVGKTESDVLADCLYSGAEKYLSDRRIRVDKSDGDKDYESNFTVLSKTDATCPAVLTENFFYDNMDDCKFMLSEDGKDRMAQAHVEGVKLYFAKKLS